MIVKNESKIIKRLFDSIINIIDSYCICDTGSTDNTIEVIENYFNEKNIPGKIIQEPFKNFAYNRTFALNAAYEMSDYLLLLDADMILKINKFNKNKLGYFDMYRILQGNDNFKYENVRIVKNNGLNKYIGVTHEYLSSTIPDSNLLTSFLPEDELFIIDIGDGGTKSDKFHRDINLLTQGLIDEPENINRYTFYLANSYKCIDNSEKAIEYYLKVLSLDSWGQEKYMSCLELYKCYDKLEKTKEGIYYLIKSFNYDKERVECIYNLIVHYCCLDMGDVAMNFYNLIKNSFENNKMIYSGKLFVESIIYDFYLPYYMVIVADQVKDIETGIKMYEIVFEKKPKYFVEWWIKNLMYNLQFLINNIPLERKENFIKLANEYFRFLYDNGMQLQKIWGKNLLEKYKNNGINFDYIVVEDVVNILNNCSDENNINSLIYELKFNKEILVSKSKIIIDNEINAKINNEIITFKSSSSCLIKTENGYTMNIRYVNYYINEFGNYLNCDKYIISINKNIELDNNLNLINQKLFKLKFEDRRYIGIEDIKIFKDIETNNILFIGTGFHKNDNIGIVSGIYDLINYNLVANEIVTNFNNLSCEKNWVFFDYNGSTHIVYNWYPLNICKINKDTNELYTVEQKNMPNIFKKVRGSTCGFKYNESEIWFVTHIVSYENPRNYYHMIVVFDSNMNLLKYSMPFKFEGEPIEYCLSIVVEDDRVLINYSTWDRTTRISICDKYYIESILKYK